MNFLSRKTQIWRMENSSREELIKLLEEQRNENLKKNKNIEVLNEKVIFQKVLIENYKKSMEFIGTDQSTQTDVNIVLKQSRSTQSYIESSDKSVQTSTSESESTDDQAIKKAIGMDLSAHQSTKFGSIAHDNLGILAGNFPINASTDVTRKKYKCDNCTYVTNKKSSYDDHCAEFCAVKAKKNIKCQVCDELFTYRGLRVHLNHYASGKTKPIGKHAKYSPSQHKSMLEQHKNKNKLNE